MQANPDESCSDYLRRALDYHQERTGEDIQQIAARAGLSADYLIALTRAGGVSVPMADIMRLCEVVPALLPHELLYLHLREEDPGSRLSPSDLLAVRRDYAERQRAGALQRGENTSYDHWHDNHTRSSRRQQDIE